MITIGKEVPTLAATILRTVQFDHQPSLRSNTTEPRSSFLCEVTVNDKPERVVLSTHRDAMSVILMPGDKVVFYNILVGHEEHGCISHHHASGGVRLLIE